MTIIVHAKPLVGILAKDNTIALVRKGDQLTCRLGKARFWLIQTILAVSSCFLSFIIWLSWVDRSKHLPMLWAGLLWVLAALCWLAFLRNLAGTPRFEYSRASGELHLYRWRSKRPWKTLRRADVEHLAIDAQLYIYEGGQALNYVLIAVTAGGKDLPLCVSVDQSLIEAISTELSGLGKTRRVAET
jgi:hypothetical protein